MYSVVGMNKTGAHRMVDFTFISNPIGPSSKARHAMRKAIGTVHRLPQTHFLTRHLCSTEGITEEQILLGHGASHVLALLLRVLHPRSIVLPSPVQRSYEDILRGEQVELSPFPLDPEQGFMVDRERFKDFWRDAEAALILNPHAPTGGSIPEDLLADLTRISWEQKKLLIVDETLRDFTVNPPLAREVIRSPHAIILRTFSTFYALAGLRLGYAIGHQALLSRIRQRMEPWPLNSLAPPAALASLKDKGYRKRTAEFMAAETAYGLKKLQGLQRIKPLGTPWGFFLQVQPRIANLKDLFSAGGLFIDEYGDAQGNQYLSFPFRSHPENATFFRALQRILREQRQTEEGRSLR